MIMLASIKIKGKMCSTWHKGTCSIIMKFRGKVSKRIMNAIKEILGRKKTDESVIFMNKWRCRE